MKKSISTSLLVPEQKSTTIGSCKRLFFAAQYVIVIFDSGYFWYLVGCLYLHKEQLWHLSFTQYFKMSSILGISAFYHDSAACILIDGKIIAAAQEERFTRIKHDPKYPYNAIEFVLKFSNLKLSEVCLLYTSPSPRD